MKVPGCYQDRIFKNCPNRRIDLIELIIAAINILFITKILIHNII